jgi:hypothetical protein
MKNSPAVRRVVRRLAIFLASLIAGLVGLVLYATSGRGAPGRSSVPLLTPGEGPRAATLAELTSGRAVVEPGSDLLILELPPMDLPAWGAGQRSAMVLSPLVTMDLPASGFISGFHIELIDAGGARLPQSLVHHINLYDPNRRELFAPIQLHLFAASKETPAAAVPRLLFGIPVEQGQRVTAKAMLGNETDVAYAGVKVRLVGTFSRVNPAWPLFRGYPWVMDVLFPVGRQPGGSKAFDLPPGRSSRSWVSSPAIPGTIIGMGGHAHDLVTSLEFTDSTTGEVLWRGAPVLGPDGVIKSLPVSLFTRWNRLGIHVTPAHRYQVTVTYENPGSEVIVDGGMGAVAGMFVPDRGTTWPAVDPADPSYWQYLSDIAKLPSGTPEMVGHHHD